MTTLYTLQAPEHDITREHEPRRDYSEPGRPYYDISRFLGWRWWLWCFQRLEDFNNEWIICRPSLVLWTLRVPAQEIRWCSLDAQCENHLPVEEWFTPFPEIIREAGDVPMALVEGPARREWVRRRELSRL